MDTHLLEASLALHLWVIEHVPKMELPDELISNLHEALMDALKRQTVRVKVYPYKLSDQRYADLLTFYLNNRPKEST